MMNPLDLAIRIATEAHAGQTDKAGQLYILHPLRVMFQLESEEARIVAVLHDVIEDTDITLSDLQQQGFSETVLHALDCLTKRHDEEYEVFISRVLSSELAVCVKIADIKDNLNVSRLDSLSDSDLARIAKYHRALMRLTSSEANV